jgi:hypothetical protein
VGFVSAAPATPDTIPALINPLSTPKLEPNPSRGRRLSGQGWLTVFVCAGAALVYLSLAMQSVVVFLIGELICVALAPFVLWGERRNIRSWLKSRHSCTGCGVDLRGVKGPCPTCGQKRFIN